MNRLYIDIETIPAGNPDPPENFEAPANYVKAEAILKHQTEAAAKEFLKRSVVTYKSKILCIAYAIDDEPVQVIYDGDEATIVKTLMDKLNETEELARDLQSVEVIGHNVMFDVKTIVQRCFKYNIPCKPLSILTAYHNRISDTMMMFTLNDRKDLVSLDTLCDFFGFAKKPMKGSDVYQYYLEGRVDEILEYCIGDVDKVRAIYKRLMGIG